MELFNVGVFRHANESSMSMLDKSGFSSELDIDDNNLLVETSFCSLK